MNNKREIYINNKKIGNNEPTYFIADIAANHDGDLERAKDLIYLAKEAGANCAKFQHFLPNKIVSDYGFKHLKTAQSHQAFWEKSVYETYEQYHCRRDWTLELVETCKKADIEFMTTPYDFEILKELDKYVNAYKIGSGDITWIDFLEEVANLKKPLLLACGASSMIDVERALNAILPINKEVILMQCNTNYTASLENYKYINLNVLKTFNKNFPNLILGLSDHTFGHSTVLGAVALGARVIEKHFTDDNFRKGPDHKFAMNTKSWKEMVDRTRELENALGNGIKAIEDNEKDTVIVQRRSIRLKHFLKAGSIITNDDIEFLRPAPLGAFPPYEKELVLNKKLLIDKEQGDCIFRSDILD